MTSRSKRASLRVRLAVAAAVLVGGGAAAAVAVATHSNAVAAQSAGYSRSVGRTMSYTSAMSSAMNGWRKSPSHSLMTMSHMKPMSSTMMMAWHTHVIALQRGTVVAVSRHQLVVESFNRRFEVWNLNHGTKVLNVGPSRTGMAAMGGGTMKMPAHMNMRAKGLAKGDLVFIFGEKIKGKLVAQLVLFVAPLKVTPVMTPTATPTATMTTTPTTTPTATPTATMTTTPTATMTAPATTPGSLAPTHF